MILWRGWRWATAIIWNWRAFRSTESWGVKRERAMRVIITGGTGLIGSTLAHRLAKEDHEIIVLSRNKNKTAGLPKGARVVEWDAHSAKGWGELADGAGAIVNLAGESIAGEGFPPKRWTPARKKRILESRINAGKAVVEAVETATNK